MLTESEQVASFRIVNLLSELAHATLPHAPGKDIVLSAERAKALRIFIDLIYRFRPCPSDGIGRIALERSIEMLRHAVSHYAGTGVIQAKDAELINQELSALERCSRRGEQG
jgi:hypothetical protein